MKLVDVKSGIQINFDVENNDKDPKVEFVRISKYKNIMQKATLQICLKWCLQLKS